MRATLPPAVARTEDPAGVATCGRISDAARACLLAAEPSPAMWAACQVEPVFAFVDVERIRASIFGAELAPDQARARVAALAGTWRLTARGNDDAIAWRIAPDGALAARRTPKRGKPYDEPVRQIAFHRDRLLAVATGTARQFVPAHVEGDRLYLSWTSGAFAHPIGDGTAFVLDVANGERFAVWNGSACTVVDVRRGVSPAACAWQGDAFAIDGVLWPRLGQVLVHPAMEVFVRTNQGKNSTGLAIGTR